MLSQYVPLQNQRIDEVVSYQDLQQQGLMACSNQQIPKYRSALAVQWNLTIQTVLNCRPILVNDEDWIFWSNDAKVFALRMRSGVEFGGELIRRSPKGTPVS